MQNQTYTQTHTHKAIIQCGVTEIVGEYYKYSSGSSTACGTGNITCMHAHTHTHADDTHTFPPQNLMECEAQSTVQNANVALY